MATIHVSDVRTEEWLIRDVLRIVGELDIFSLDILQRIKIHRIIQVGHFDSGQASASRLLQSTQRVGPSVKMRGRFYLDRLSILDLKSSRSEKLDELLECWVVTEEGRCRIVLLCLIAVIRDTLFGLLA